MQSHPYVPDSSLKGSSDSLSVDRIALGIGYLLHDIEASQFPDECHPPEHVAQSQVPFNTIESLIHPTLDDFLEVVQDNNNLVSDKNTLKTLSLSPFTRLPPMAVNLKGHRQ